MQSPPQIIIKTLHVRQVFISLVIFAGLFCSGVSTVSAQVTFDVIGPHEYELPVGFKPFNVFVQYGLVQNGKKTWDNNGDRQSIQNTQTLVGLTKYVHFWSPESAPHIGLAYEIIVPEVGVRNTGAKTSTGGVGDPLTGPAVWYKPSPDSTLGFQSFFQIPVGDKDIGGGDVWKNYSSFLWDVRFGKWDYSADAGFVFFGKSASADARPGTLFHTNQRLGYRVSELLEPFVALDYENQRSWTNSATGVVNPRSSETDAGLGLMFHYLENQSISLRYSRGFDGRNHEQTDSFNIKYVLVF